MYARALFDAASERGRLAEVHADLREFMRASEEVPELRAVLRDPVLDPQKRRAALDAVLTEADELFRNFVRLLAEKGRTAELDGIAREFERLVAAEERRLEVDLTTAVELSDDEARQVVEQIERASGRTVEATRSVDPDLIGGLILQADNFRVDASVRGRLERLRTELVTGS
jgi:F-type H+-transporting ATPase subunit delta